MAVELTVSNVTDRPVEIVFRLVPQTDTSRSALASVLGHLGEIDEARRVWAELKKINPRTLSPSALPGYRSAIQRIQKGSLRAFAKAGLPD